MGPGRGESKSVSKNAAFLKNSGLDWNGAGRRWPRIHSLSPLGDGAWMKGWIDGIISTGSHAFKLFHLLLSARSVGAVGKLLAAPSVGGRFDGGVRPEDSCGRRSEHSEHRGRLQWSQFPSSGAVVTQSSIVSSGSDGLGFRASD